MGGSSHSAVVAVDVHGRVGEVVSGRHGCGSTSSMRRGTRTTRIRHVGNRSALPLISRTCNRSFLVFETMTRLTNPRTMRKSPSMSEDRHFFVCPLLPSNQSLLSSRLHIPHCQPAAKPSVPATLARFARATLLRSINVTDRLKL